MGNDIDKSFVRELTAIRLANMAIEVEDVAARIEADDLVEERKSC